MSSENIPVESKPISDSQQDMKIGSSETTGFVKGDTIEYTDEMGEISGFGGRYEAACRSMVEAGYAFIMENEERRNKVLSCRKLGEVEEIVEKAMYSVCNNPSGAMFGACLQHISFLVVNGKEKYIQNMTQNEEG